MEHYIKRIPLIILFIILALFVIFYNRINVLIVAIMCMLIPISLGATLYASKAKSGNTTISAPKYLTISLVIGMLIGAAVYFGATYFMANY